MLILVKEVFRKGYVFEIYIFIENYIFIEMYFYDIK